MVFVLALLPILREFLQLRKNSNCSFFGSFANFFCGGDLFLDLSVENKLPFCVEFIWGSLEKMC
jgi:hypothetical protein